MPTDKPRPSVSELGALISSSWCQATASPSCQDDWDEDRPALGQCAVTALLVQDVLGGEVMRTVIVGHGSHYYNRLPDGAEIDLTRSQFPSDAQIPPGQPVERDQVLHSARAQSAYTELRYQLLKARFDRNVPKSK